MTGFPPSADDQVTLANWRTSPFNRWAFQHVREIVPSADIANDPDHVWALPDASMDLSGIAVAGGSFAAFLDATDTDGLVVLHRGAMVGEIYGNAMTCHTPHILMSVSKSVLGLVAGILSERGVLDPEALVSDLISEIAGSAYRGCRVHQLLDMRAGVLFDENYLATSGAIIAYRKAQGWNPLEPGETPSDLRSFFPSLVEADGPHGGRFHYVSPNTDLLGWVIERATGQRYADVVSSVLWQPMGAERSAYITVDRFGAPRCAGGFCATTRDLARIGQLIVQDGCRDGRRILPAGWVDDILTVGDRAAWDDGDFASFFPGSPMHYRSKWYVQHGDAPLLFGIGVNGQNLFIDRANQIVIAKFSSQAAPLDEARITLTMQAVAAIRRHLTGL